MDLADEFVGLGSQSLGGSPLIAGELQKGDLGRWATGDRPAPRVSRCSGGLAVAHELGLAGAIVRERNMRPSVGDHLDLPRGVLR